MPAYHRTLLSLAIFAAALPTAFAAEPQAEGSLNGVIEETVVVGVRQRLYDAGTLLDAIQKTEVVDETRIKAMQAVNLTQAIEKSPGVRVSNECSMCGVKRIMLNGMRGEHSTILTDGIPLHTMMAGYYAVDALATTGVERIEVARGAGASLLAPEAIGGTINVISKEPQETGFNINASWEDNDSFFVGMMGSHVSDDDRTRTSLVYQGDKHHQMDNDNNGVSEAPLQENTSYVGRVSHDFTERDNLVLRLAYTDSTIFGGPQGYNIGTVLRGFDGVESEHLFENDDVRAKFTGKPWETTEWIDTERTEVSANWLREFNEHYNAMVTLAWSEHRQDSFYEGFDYAATDQLFYFDWRNNLIVNEAHTLTFGMDLRDEEMRSDSVAGAESADYVEDSFDYRTGGVYLQDTWQVSPQLEVAAAVRLDRVRADFVAEEKPGTEIEETLLVPRIDMRYLHNDQWTSRLAFGRGYRAPLSFFETDHGILDAGDGFAIEIDKLEKSLSATYALSYEGERLSGTLSLAHTTVEHLAALGETENGVPLLTQMRESAVVSAGDISLGYTLNEALKLAVTLEGYDYDRIFKESYAITPIEQRALFSLDYGSGPWMLYAGASWVGQRDLGDYGYEGYNQPGRERKSNSAESYWTLDMKVAFDVSENLNVYVGGNNITDYTQVNDAETPLFWDAGGAYDVAYIYGPLRGREFYLGFDWNW
ncbi:TonB-dependent receptor plug domain-containing protein [Microbulbifer spongiae]|uniref:TonB-dependent receptor n=1 Tax=Microbulbifer spongiae TaxID=2944933 RepID=A0ABY9E8V8_9GAMM|nr:TonB-dependent receptor [Microbulbifer sp. MI-G]WKD49455.1 TonB-dependent receptor [Microbulbifer sp. MI-G]